MELPCNSEILKDKELRAFFAACFTAPGAYRSDLPRLVFADWLDERQNPMGAYIRAEVAHHQDPSEANAEAMRAKRKAAPQELAAVYDALALVRTPAEMEALLTVRDFKRDRFLELLRALETVQPDTPEFSQAITDYLRRCRLPVGNSVMIFDIPSPQEIVLLCERGFNPMAEVQDRGRTSRMHNLIVEAFAEIRTFHFVSEYADVCASIRLLKERGADLNAFDAQGAHLLVQVTRDRILNNYREFRECADKFAEFLMSEGCSPYDRPGDRALLEAGRDYLTEGAADPDELCAIAARRLRKMQKWYDANVPAAGDGKHVDEQKKRRKEGDDTGTGRGRGGASRRRPPRQTRDEDASDDGE